MLGNSVPAKLTRYSRSFLEPGSTRLIFKAVARDRQVPSRKPTFPASQLPNILERDFTRFFIVSWRAFHSAIHGENHMMEECLVAFGIAKKCGTVELIGANAVYIDSRLVMSQLTFFADRLWPSGEYSSFARLNYENCQRANRRTKLVLQVFDFQQLAEIQSFKFLGLC
jgi:hypothetical protein